MKTPQPCLVCGESTFGACLNIDCPSFSREQLLDRSLHGVCIVCGSDDVFSELNDYDAPALYIPRRCGTCGSEWSDGYTLDRIVPADGEPSIDLNESLTVVVHVRGGVVEHVDAPTGVIYEVRDYDNCPDCGGTKCDGGHVRPCPAKKTEAGR